MCVHCPCKQEVFHSQFFGYQGNGELKRVLGLAVFGVRENFLFLLFRVVYNLGSCIRAELRLLTLAVFLTGFPILYFMVVLF